MAEVLERAIAWRPPDYIDDLSVSNFIAEDICTPEEIAARLKVPPSWVYEKTRSRCRNRMPCLRLGRYIRFDWKAVVNWLMEQCNEAKSS